MSSTACSTTHAWATASILPRIIVKGKAVPDPVFTIPHGGNDEALAAHARFLQANMPAKWPWTIPVSI